tara:strand:+ start:1836 stop:2252 length:417 start_codon:yes stop_codon:yes gene_type:complete
MITIESTYCGACNNMLSEDFASSIIGTTYVECDKCFTLNKTKMKPWSKLSQYERVESIFTLFMGDIITIVSLGCTLLILFISDWSVTEIFENDRGGPFLGSLIVFLIYNGFKLKNLNEGILIVEKQEKIIEEKLQKGI